MSMIIIIFTIIIFDIIILEFNYYILNSECIYIILDFENNIHMNEIIDIYINEKSKYDNILL